MRKTTVLQKPIGLFGGTFDPVHLGHIQIARKVLQTLKLKEIRFIPNYNPPLKDETIASTKHRLNMLKIALENEPNFVIDEREINRTEKSYTIDTLKSLRSELPNTPFCWIMGFDQLAQFNRWHSWKILLDYAHFIIINRPQPKTALNPIIENFLKQKETKDSSVLHKNLNGFIYHFDIKPIFISATEIRKQLAVKKQPVDQLPEGVWKYIQKNKLYV